jgi:hypothetical protein
MAYDPKTNTSLVNKLRSDVDGLLIREAILEVQFPSGTDGGSAIHTITADSTLYTADLTSVTADQTNTTWSPRPLNTVTYDDGDTVEQLAGNVFTLEPGIYKIKAVFVFHHTEMTRMQLWNGTDQIVECYGLNGDFKANQQGVLDLNAIVRPKKRTSYQIRYQVQNEHMNNGLGQSTDFAGVPEQYGCVEITRLNRLKPD